MNATVKYRQEVIEINRMMPSKYFQYLTPCEVLTSNKTFNAIHYTLCLCLILVSIFRLVLCMQDLGEREYADNLSEKNFFITFSIIVNCSNIFLAIYVLFVSIYLPRVPLLFAGLGIGIVSLLINFVRVAFRATDWNSYISVELLIVHIIALTLLYGVVFSVGIMLKNLQLKQSVKIVDV